MPAPPLRFALLGLVVLAGCRLESAPPCDCADGRDVADAPPDTVRVVRSEIPPEGPPVPAGDARPIPPDEAGAPDGPSTVTVAASGLAVPVAGVEPDDLVDTFTAARSGGRTHDAIDILAPRGTPVVAAADGAVLRRFVSDAGGLTVYQLGDAVLPDGRRTVYYYAHLDATAPGLGAGDRLRRGDVLGTVGDSGNAAPGNTHLHFAIWRTDDPGDFWDGTPVNPYPLLTGR